MNYNKSKFNIFVPYNNGEMIVFNSLSGALGKMEADVYKHFEDDSLREEEKQLLVKKGILVPEDCDETLKIHTDRAEGINNEKKKLFRIWPTSGCNANCYYCFECGIKKVTMTEIVADGVVSFIDSMLNEGDKLILEWFGGEPLLNVSVIDYIISKLKVICEAKKCEIDNTMISNGSLIDEKIAKKMKDDWKLSSIQITLDGIEEDYNRIKSYQQPNKHNFLTVINAIKLLSLNGIHVSIRMNYDTNNYESLSKLIDFLHKELSEYKKISYYVYPIWSSTDETVERAFESKTVADKNLLYLFEKLVSNKMSTIRKIARLNYKKHACYAWNRTSMAILPDGKISKCCESFNVTIGDIWNGITDTKTYNFWTNSQVEEKCENCVYLPLCQGGCKSSYFNRMPQCFAFKPIIEDILKWYVWHLDNEGNI